MATKKVAKASATAQPAAGASERNPAFKLDLDLKIIKRLDLAQMPVGYAKDGKLLFGPNPPVDKSGAPIGPRVPSYIIWDSNKSAPPGFGVRIAAKKTFIIRRKVLGRSLMPNVGNVADYFEIDKARRKAAELALKMVETGKNPNVEARRIAANEFTLGICFERYTTYLTTRKVKPAKPDTLKVIKRVVKRFGEFKWLDRKISDFKSEEILKKFAEGEAFKTANEQRFRWAIAAINWNIDREKFDASAQNRDPLLGLNPFEILVLENQFRDRDTLNKEREENGARNPLGPTTTLGPFLEAAWSKRRTNDNATGIDYLMLMLLWGCRKSEHAACQWGELLPEGPTAKPKPGAPPEATRKNTSHVWLDDDPQYGAYVFFHNTKNGKNHRLPIGTMALELLQRRQVAAAEEAARRGFGSKSRKFVFPAKSIHSKSGHYNDAKDLLDRLRDEVGVAKINRHDLRRSFGAMMTSLEIDESIKKAFFNHSSTNVTDDYTKAEWALLRKCMNRIEQAILVTAPNAYNALKPVEWPPIPAPDPHVCKPAAPRSGRPKNALSSGVAG